MLVNDDSPDRLYINCPTMKQCRRADLLKTPTIIGPQESTEVISEACHRMDEPQLMKGLIQKIRLIS